MISDGLDGKRGLRIDHVREREISRGRDVVFAAGQGKILLLNFVWSDLKSRASFLPFSAKLENPCYLNTYLMNKGSTFSST